MLSVPFYLEAAFGYEVEEAVSRILYQCRLSTTLTAIIYLGRKLLSASSNQPEGLQTSSLQA